MHCLAHHTTVSFCPSISTPLLACRVRLSGMLAPVSVLSIHQASSIPLCTIHHYRDSNLSPNTYQCSSTAGKKLETSASPEKESGQRCFSISGKSREWKKLCLDARLKVESWVCSLAFGRAETNGKRCPDCHALHVPHHDGYSVQNTSSIERV